MMLRDLERILLNLKDYCKMSTYKLKDFVDPIAITVQNPAKSGYERFVGLEHYDSGELVIKRYSGVELLTTNAKAFQKNDILIARRNVYLRRAGVIYFNGITSGDSIVLRVKADCKAQTGVNRELAQKVLPLVLNTDKFWIYANKHADGMNSKRISKDMLMEYEFDLPSLEEQKVLADKLWAAYRVKEAYRQLLTTTDDMVKAIFQKMFGEGEYPSKALQEICKTLVAGGDKPSDISEIKSSEYPFPIYSNGEGERGLMGYAKTYKIKDDAITIAARGLVGYTAIRRGKFTPVVRLITIVPNSEINLFYLKYFLDTIEFKATGGAQKQLTIPNVEKEQIIVPPIELQKEFAAVFNQAEATKASLRESIASIDRVIRSLINQ